MTALCQGNHATGDNAFAPGLQSEAKTGSEEEGDSSGRDAQAEVRCVSANSFASLSARIFINRMQVFLHQVRRSGKRVAAVSSDDDDHETDTDDEVSLERCWDSWLRAQADICLLAPQRSARRDRNKAGKSDGKGGRQSVKVRYLHGSFPCLPCTSVRVLPVLTSLLSGCTEVEGC